MSQQNSSYDLNFHKILNGGGTTPDPGPTPWVRPSEWPNIDSLIGPSDDKIVMLAAVYDDLDATTNFVQIAVTVVGDFTVDWGDGTVTNYTSATNATHYYDYTNVNLTATSYGYKCAVIAVTAQVPPNLIASVTFANTLPAGIKSIPILDFDARVPGCTFISALGTLTALRFHLQQCRVRSSSITSFNGFLSFCYYLQSVPQLETSVPATYESALSACTNLRSISGLVLNSASSIKNLFVGCSSLQSVSGLTANSATDISGMFNSCRALTSISNVSLSGATTLLSPFASCTALRYVSDLNLNAATSLGSLFSSLSSLYSVSNITSNSCTSFFSMFASCGSLEHVSGLTTAAGTNFTSMFSTCGSLQSIPPMNTSSGINFTGFFAVCKALTSIPLMDTSSGTTFDSMFNGCQRLVTAPNFNMSNGTSFSNIFAGCSSLVEVPALDFGKAISFISTSTSSLVRFRGIFKNNANVTLTNTKLSGAALNEVYTNLPVASGSPSITITGAPGVSGDDPTIATAKGWTVTGS